MNDFNSTHIEEPSLKFDGGESKDPRTGLIKYGPRTPAVGEEHKVAKIGIVGSAFSISGIEELLHQMKSEIPPEDAGERWNPPFPGLGKDSPLKLSLDVQKRWREKISDEEIQEVEQQPNRKEKVKKAVEIFEKKIELIYGKESPPDVIMVSIPERIYETCTFSKSGDAKIQSDDIDFHNRIKLIGMKKGIPTQLVKPKTLKREKTQDDSDIAWNLAVGILYKSRKGHPWKLTELETGTCYVGISFYKEKNKDRTRTSMAQVFLETGESFVLRGDPIEDEKKGPGNNHLTTEDAENLVEKVLEQYEDIKGHSPSRLVIHKTSYFWEDEKEGFLQGASDIEEKDFVTIHDRTSFRAFAGNNDYPVVRGTLTSHESRNQFYLFTVGYIPSLQTYPGHRVPAPIRIIPDEDVNDSSYKEIADEILSFTKLDWNTSHFCRKMPVTTVVSDSVGDILSEATSQDIDIDPHYYFYM